MMELGEGLCKLRKMNFSCGPFYQFEQEICAVQNFIYQTQLELAACMDESSTTYDLKRSYQPLGGFGTRSEIYVLEGDIDGTFHISFDPKGLSSSITPSRVKVPILKAETADLIALERE
ncbi:unnamed protein product [Victoria cruziana]